MCLAFFFLLFLLELCVHFCLFFLVSTFRVKPRLAGFFFSSRLYVVLLIGCCSLMKCLRNCCLRTEMVPHRRSLSDDLGDDACWRFSFSVLPRLRILRRWELTTLRERLFSLFSWSQTALRPSRSLCMQHHCYETTNGEPLTLFSFFFPTEESRPWSFFSFLTSSLFQWTSDSVLYSSSSCQRGLLFFHLHGLQAKLCFSLTDVHFKIISQTCDILCFESMHFLFLFFFPASWRRVCVFFIFISPMLSFCSLFYCREGTCFIHVV